MSFVENVSVCVVTDGPNLSKQNHPLFRFFAITRTRHRPSRLDENLERYISEKQSSRDPFRHTTYVHTLALTQTRTQIR